MTDQFHLTDVCTLMFTCAPSAGRQVCVGSLSTLHDSK